MNILGKGLFDAEVAKLEAEVAEAKAILNIYFNKSVGIGEHPDLLTEVDKYVDKLAAAEDKVESLKRNFGQHTFN
jgi:hypothetical protein